ncbi:unnamed protein product [Notodromas monacha]|uniref:Cadherin domain-containing protein n=1 Tax=Notodromas monacha TaxID=399045 RepID=A0A7R9BLI8_9CRUS|nr:unnamed protein product [Notodromas monacha]CAG0916856.1 unnamed protein product [Notodromas monacha]
MQLKLSRKHFFAFVTIVGALLLDHGALANFAPRFTADMNGHLIPESTPVHSSVYKLEGEDPENDPLRFGILNSNLFSVEPITGVVRLLRKLDRESQMDLRLNLTLVDSEPSNQVVQSIVAFVLDENDTPPKVSGLPYELRVPEDTKSGTVLAQFTVFDADLVNDGLSVRCEQETGSSSSKNDMFRLDPDTGILETAKELDREILVPSGLLILPVAVMDESFLGEMAKEPASFQLSQTTMAKRSLNDVKNVCSRVCASGPVSVISRVRCVTQGYETKWRGFPDLHQLMGNRNDASSFKNGGKKMLFKIPVWRSSISKRLQDSVRPTSALLPSSTPSYSGGSGRFKFDPLSELSRVKTN